MVILLTIPLLGVFITKTGMEIQKDTDMLEQELNNIQADIHVAARKTYEQELQLLRKDTLHRTKNSNSQDLKGRKFDNLLLTHQSIIQADEELNYADEVSLKDHHISKHVKRIYINGTNVYGD